MPMNRPDDAFGMMSVMSAQSTARNVPEAMPMSSTPATRTGGFGASPAMTSPTPPIAQAT